MWSFAPLHSRSVCKPKAAVKHVKLCIFTWTSWLKRFFTISSSSRRAQMALSLLDTSSSRYWYLSFFLALHSLALWRLRSSLAFRSIFAGLRPRFPGFLTLPATIWRQRQQSVIYQCRVTPTSRIHWHYWYWLFQHSSILHSPLFSLFSPPVLTS